MNVIISFVTPNNPNLISIHAVESIKHACSMWNCDYVLITSSLQPIEYHDMFTKLYLPHQVKDYDRCLYLDTDIVIKHNAPNPFDTFSNDECCYVVKDMQQPFLSEVTKQHFKDNQLCGPWYEECKRVLNINLDYKSYSDNFFNAGMYMFTPNKHIHLFDIILKSFDKIQPHYKQIHQVEQALLNYTFMYYLKDKLVYVSKEWNYIDPPLESESMNGYLYHFTGWKYQEYKEKIKVFDLWKK